MVGAFGEGIPGMTSHSTETIVVKLDDEKTQMPFGFAESALARAPVEEDRGGLRWRRPTLSYHPEPTISSFKNRYIKKKMKKKIRLAFL